VVALQRELEDFIELVDEAAIPVQTVSVMSRNHDKVGY